MEEAALENLTIRDGFERMDFECVTRMLSQSYWCPGIKIEEVKKGALNSALVVGAFVDGQKQIGYARAISDKTRFAYILDVYVDEPYRRQGIGQKMINHILAHEDLKSVYQWLLITKNAHRVYGKAGFSPVSRPGDWMEIRHPRPDR